MTCIVGKRLKNSIILGGDKQGSSGNYVDYRKKAKVFVKMFKHQLEVGDAEIFSKKRKMGFGYTSSFRMGDIIEHIFEIPDLPQGMDEEAYMVKEFIPALIKCYTANNWLKKENEVVSGGHFLVAFNQRLFHIEGDFQVTEEQDDYTSIGCGSDLAKGALYALERFNKNNITEEEKVKTALKASAHHSAWVGGGFDIIEID